MRRPHRKLALILTLALIAVATTPGRAQEAAGDETMVFPPQPYERRIGPEDAYTVLGIYNTSPESPDGKRVAYTVMDRRSMAPGSQYGTAALWIQNVDGSDSHKLRDIEFAITAHNGSFQQWVDNDTVAYSGGHHQPGDVYVINADTGETEFGPYTGAMLGDGSFGGHVLFSVWSEFSTAGEQGLYDLDTNTGKLALRYSSKEMHDKYDEEWVDGTGNPKGWFFTHLNFSTDGSHLAFDVYPGNLVDKSYEGRNWAKEHMFTVKNDGTDLKYWGTDKPMHWVWYDADQIWGVNDRVQDNMNGAGQGLMQVWTRDKEVVKTIGGAGCHTALSPDYRCVAAETWYGKDPVSLWIYRHGETTPSATVFTSPIVSEIWGRSAHVNPAFSPDGKRLYYKRPVAEGPRTGVRGRRRRGRRPRPAPPRRSPPIAAD